MEEMIEKFHHLLKPIRDLEQNWSVDLAEELTQALQSLSEQMITFGQNGDKIIDFSKAALIIQGSAHVYSKKVDYLYKTVYDMKEWMEKLWEVEKKSRAGRTRNEGDPPDLDIEENEDDDLDLSYIKEDDTWLDEAQIQDQIDGSVLLPPKPMKLTDSLHLKIPLKSMKGDIIGYMNEFLINTTDIEALLSGSDSNPMSIPAQKPLSDNSHTGTPADGDMGAPADDDMDDTHEPVTDDYVAPADVDDVPPPTQEAGPSNQTDTPVRSDRMARQLRPRFAAAQNKQPEVIVDPWSQILDPHAAVTRASKPLKPGNCRLLPPSLRKGTKRRQNGKRPAEKKTDDIATFCNKEYNPSVSNTGSNLLYPEFKSIFSDVIKKRNDELRKIKKSRVPSNVPEEEADDAYDLIRDRPEDDDEDCGNFNDGHDDDDGVPFSRLQDPGDMPPYTEGGDDLPAGYSQYLAEVVKREYEELAAHNDKLSEIDKRVKAWENTVKGAIETAETRPSFDMHFYSDSIFSSFSGDQSRLPFDRILEGKPKFEAFRTFVSALILANHGNIDIVQDQKQVELSLLHKTTLSEVIDGGETLM